MAKTKAQINRGIRQEALREQLAEQCRFQHIIENIKKIEELVSSSEDFPNEINKLKVATELRLKVANKYLPDLKHTEVEGAIDITAHENWLDKLDDE